MESKDIIIGIVALVGGSMISPIASDLWRKIKGEQYATKSFCNIEHERLKRNCDMCSESKANRMAAIEAEQHKTRKLLIMIAMRLQIPEEDLREFL